MNASKRTGTNQLVSREVETRREILEPRHIYFTADRFHATFSVLSLRFASNTSQAFLKKENLKKKVHLLLEKEKEIAFFVGLKKGYHLVAMYLSLRKGR